MTAPIITIFKNGDEFQNGKRLVLNRKEIRSFDAFLDRVTKDTRSRVAVRSIRTPSHGHRVSELDKLENGGIYVAVGPERFKKLEYKELTNLPVHKQKPADQVIKPVVHSRVVVSGRARKVAAAESTAIKTIFVFRNGDDKHPCFKILLDKRMLHTGMDAILQFITEKVRLRSGAVKSLHTLDGIEVHEPSQIKPLEKYVAVGFGKKFLKMPYNENGATVLTPRRNGVKVKSTSSEPPHRKKRPKPLVKAMSQGHVKSPSKNEKAPLDKKESPLAGERNGYVEPQTNDGTGIERSLTQDLPKSDSRGNSQAGNLDNDVGEIRKTTPVEATSKRTSRTGASVKDAVVAKSSSTEKQGKDKMKKTSTVRKKDESKEKLKEETTTSIPNSNKEQDIDDDIEELRTEMSGTTLFKATGEQGEKAITVKDNEETTVEKPLDMLPAEEVEEEIDEREVPSDNKIDSEQELKDAGDAPKSDEVAATEGVADSQTEIAEDLETGDVSHSEIKDEKTDQ